MVIKIRRLKLIALTLACALGTSSAIALDAPSVLVPAGLNQGDTFFVVFVTRNDDDLCDDADTVAAETLADNAAASGSKTSGVTGWTGLYAHTNGTNTTAAGAAFGGVTNRPIYSSNGSIVANNYADMFDGSLISSISFDEDGASNLRAPYTGFDSSGTPTIIPLGSGSSCTVGNSNTAAAQWASQGNSGFDNPIYVLSPLLTVPAAVTANASVLEW